MAQTTDKPFRQLGSDGPKAQDANHPKLRPTENKSDSSCENKRIDTDLPESSISKSRAINNLTEVFGEHHVTSKPKTNSIKNAFYYALRQHRKFVETFIPEIEQVVRDEYKIRDNIQLVNVPKFDMTGLDKPIPESSLKQSITETVIPKNKFEILEDEVVDVVDGEPSKEELKPDMANNGLNGLFVKMDEIYTKTEEVRKKIRSLERKYDPLAHLSQPEREEAYKQGGGAPPQLEMSPADLTLLDQYKGEIASLNRVYFSLKQQRDIQLINKRVKKQDANGNNVIEEDTVEEDSEKDGDFGILNAMMTIPDKAKTRKLVSKSVVVRSHRRLTNFLKIKHFMKSRTVPLINTLITDARVWLMKDGRKCDTDEDYLVMTSSVMAAYMVQEEELAFRELLRNVENHRNTRDLNSLIDDGILGHVGVLDQLKYTESTINRLKPILKMPVSIGQGF